MRPATAVTAILLLCIWAAGSTAKEPGMGQELFEMHCAKCHPEGDNIINPEKTLMKKDLDANGIKSAADIVRLMRSPGPGMVPFDEKTIPDKDAKEIAEYVLRAFRK